MLGLVALVELVRRKSSGGDRFNYEDTTSNTLILFSHADYCCGFNTYSFLAHYDFGASNRLSLTRAAHLKYSSMCFIFRQTPDRDCWRMRPCVTVQMTSAGFQSDWSLRAVRFDYYGSDRWSKLTLITMIPLPFMVILTSWYGTTEVGCSVLLKRLSVL